MQAIPHWRSLRYVILIALFGAGVWLLLALTQLTPESMAARQARLDALNADAATLMLAEGESPADETAALLEAADFWALRVSYPTGRFDPAWVSAAFKEHQLMPSSLPAGDISYNLRSGNSPLSLDGTGFTSLGPMPLSMAGCQGCFEFSDSAGRTNVIVSDPVSPTIAYLGSDGGGVWKTVNCCDANTTWMPMTDDPAMASIAIGDIVIDPNDHNTIYAGTGDLRYGSWSFGSSGVLKSVDAGETWTIIGADVFDPFYDPSAGDFPQYQAIGKVRVDPRDSDNLIVGTKTGVYFSYDAGTNWTSACLTNSFSSQRQDVTGIIVNDNGTSTDLYVAIGTRGFNTTVQPDLDQNGANGIYHTTMPASGCPASWTLITRPDNGWPAGSGSGSADDNILGRIDIAMAPSNPDVIYAQVASITTFGQEGVWRTTDGGATWEQRSDVSGLTGCFGDWGQNWYDQGVAVDPNDENVLFISTVDLFRSTNGGTTFTNVTCGYATNVDKVHVDHHALAFVDGTSTDLLVGSDGGAYITLNADEANPDDITFSQLNDSLSTIEFYSGDITANFATAAVPGINAGAQDNGSSVAQWSDGNPDATMWHMTTGGDGMFALIEPVHEQRWYQSSQNGFLKVSTTGPFGTYLSARGGWTSDTLSFIMPFAMFDYNCPISSGCMHMLGGTHRVWETTRGAVPASSWRPNSPDLTKGTLGNRSFINNLSYSITARDIAIAGTNDGNVWMGFGLGQNIANSATWVDLTDGNSVLPNRPIMDVTTHPQIPTIGFASLGGFEQNTPGQAGHVYQVTCNSDCSSFTWEDKSGNLPNIPVNSIIVNPLMPTQVYAGSDWGLYVTDDVTVASPVWYKFTEGLPSVMIWDMTIDRGFTTIVLFTRSRGAYAYPLPGPTFVWEGGDFYIPFVQVDD